MDVDLILYVIILSFSVGFGYFYRQIKDKQQKKWAGSVVGLFVIFITSTYHTWHPMLLFAANTGIILLLPKSHCHIISFFYSFLHLLCFRLSTMNFGNSYLPVHTNLIQMMLTLKLVGLAFEVNAAHALKKTATGLNAEKADIAVNFQEIFHYAFNYIGIATGPYYRYRTFKDFFEMPFNDKALCNRETIRILAYVLLFFVLHLWGIYNWPLSYALSDEFYNERSWMYRFWYAWPTFFNFRMQVYSGVLMSEAVCTMVGFGAYPSKAKSKPGHGPSKNYEHAHKICNGIRNEIYDFNTIRNMNPYEADFCTTFRNAMKNWNMCIQYWLFVNIYRRFPNKKLRTGATMFVSAFWHGLYIGYYVCICSVPFYLALEDVYVKLLLKNSKGMSLKAAEWLLWFCKMQAFSYFSVAFHLLVFEEVARYYQSTYYCGYVIGAILYVGGHYMLRMRTRKYKKQQAQISNGKEKNNKDYLNNS